MFPIRNISTPITFIAVISLTVLTWGCKKLVEVSSPATSTNADIVYSSDATAISVLTGIYTKISSSNIIFPGTVPSLSLCAGLSADELTLGSSSFSVQLNAYYTNTLSNNIAGYEYWPTFYNYIFACNSAIENLQGATALTPAVQKQLLGEAKFMRAFFYFYLTSLYGDVPLALSSNYKVNSTLTRTAQSTVYQQIISDLRDAQSSLSNSYLDVTLLKTTTEKVRPTRWVATALLSRVYLYTGDWADAKTQADSMIINTALFSLSSLPNVFLKNSSEVIWQLQPVTTGAITNTSDAVLYHIPITGPSSSYPVYLSNRLLSSFEAGDNRRTSWVDSAIVNGTTYYYPYKYRAYAQGAAVTEYSMLFRLAEQYLIRAEAKVQQGDATAVSDLNVVRNRAGLGNYSGPMDKQSLLTAILHERQVELFAELGQRWLDLKRSTTINTVMSGITPQKGGIWSSNAQLYPIGISDLKQDPNLIQNSGY